jgi:membrane protein
MFRLLFQSTVSFVKDHGQMLAASISCYFMLSFIPFFIFLASVMGLVFAGHEGFQNFLIERISDFFPAVTADIREELLKLIEKADVGLITLLGYLFFSYHLYVSLEMSVNAVYKFHGTRRLLSSIANSLLVITLLMAVVLVTFGTTAALSLLVHLGRFIGLPRIDILVGLTGFVVPLLLVFLTATALYRVLPRKKVSLTNAMRGAVFTAIFLEAAKYVFTFYIAIKLVQFGPFYGSLTGVVVLMMWLIYSASIFLIGAGFVRNLETALGR